jgi:predicted phosphate transport protein (TIGR00153 family)
VFHALSRFRLTPSDDGFFELFRAAAENCRDCAKALRELVGSLLEPGALVEEVKVFEERGDELTVEILNRLDRSFVTPFDREDIHALGEELDDVVDAMHSAASLIELAHNDDAPPELVELADTLVEMADELVALVGCLPSGEGARRYVERIGHLERQGDAAFRHGMGKLLSGAYEPLVVIAWKDIIQAVETSLNSIEDASEVIEGILVKNS